MAIWADRWNKLKSDVGKLLLGGSVGYGGGDTWLRDVDDPLFGDYYRPAAEQSLDMTLSSVVMPFILWKMRAYPDAAVSVRRRMGPEEWEPDPGHAAAMFLSRPNPLYDWMTHVSGFDFGHGHRRQLVFIEGAHDGGQVVGPLLDPAGDDPAGL